jgi:hypothetical protein
VTVTGLGFTPSGSVEIYFGTSPIPIPPTRADSTGAISTSFIVPSVVSGVPVSEGIYRVAVEDKSSQNQGTASFLVTTLPPITLKPTTGPVGSPVAVTGSGFTPSKSVEIYFDTPPRITSATANATGAIPSGTSFIVPSLCARTYTVSAKDVTTGNYAAAPFTVLSPSITLRPNRGPPGSPVAVTGSGFTPGGRVDIRFGRSPNVPITSRPIATITASPTGTISKTVPVPSKAPKGILYVMATDSTAQNSVIVTFTVT